MIVNKITHGWVTQKFDSETGKCLSQSFFAGDLVELEDDIGDSLDESDYDLEYQSFDMVQP